MRNLVQFWRGTEWSHDILRLCKTGDGLVSALRP